MRTSTIQSHQLSKGGKLLNILLSLVLVIGLMPALTFASTQQAFAEDEDITGTVTGGETICSEGVYQIAQDAASVETGTITIDTTDPVTLVGWGSDCVYTNLYVHCVDGANLTIRNLYDQAGTGMSKALFYYEGSGSFSIEGTNVLLDDNKANYAIVYCGYGDLDGDGNTVTLGGTGTAYVYYTGVGGVAFGAGTADVDPEGAKSDICGNLTVTGGTWYTKQSKRTTIFGSDNTTTPGGTITFAGGEFYVKGLSMAPGIGSTYMGMASNIVVEKGANVTLYQDYTGKAISGNGNDTIGYPTLTVNGGSLKLIQSTNAIYGNTYVDEDATTYSISACGATSDKSMLIFDASEYVGEDNISVVDLTTNKEIYDGKISSSVTNEVKNPGSGELYDTIKLNWMANAATSKLTNPTMATNYPTENGTVLAQDNNLGIWLPKQDCSFTVNGVQYDATYDSENNTFTYAKAVSKDPTLSVSTEATNLRVGDQFVAYVNLANMSAASVEATVDYDSSVLQLDAIEQGAGLVLDEGGQFIGKNGKFSIIGNSASATDGLQVAKLTFTCIAESDGTSINVKDAFGSESTELDEVTIAAGDPVTVAVGPQIYDYTLGDINNNGRLNVVDAQIVLDLGNGKYGDDYAKLLSGLAAKGTTWNFVTAFACADYNVDGKVNALDARAIQYATING